MTTVNVTIDGVVLFCNDSVISLELGNGYFIKKRYLNDISFKNKITDGNGNVSINYIGSQLHDSKGTYFMCIQKNDTYQIQLSKITTGVIITDKELMCEEQLEQYMDDEIEYLNKKFSLLRLFKEGNIGYKEIFLEHRFTVMEYINNTKKQTSDSVTKNIVDKEIFILTQEEAKG